MYRKIDMNESFVSKELEIEQFWKDNKIFEKSIELRKDSKIFTFFDGPPTANGKPHIGHVITRAVKDLFPRYKTMKGYKVLRKAGWDTHGLPVELEVEKQLGISGKPQIESFGVEPFIQKCKESVWHYENEWRKMSDRVGFWVDMDNPYVTYHNNYIESVWWALKTIWDKKLIYKGYKIVPYCPRCGTALSSHEVAQGYKDVIDTTAFAKFQLKNKNNEFFIAWTTTPWTLPSNVALAVNANEDYVKVFTKTKNEYYYLAKALLNSVLTEEYEIIEEYKGKDLKGIEYIPLFDYFKQDHNQKIYYLVCDNYVTLTDGSGIVHIAPAFGEDDSRLGKDYNLPFVQLVNSEGNFIEGCGNLSGVFIKDADKLVIESLKNRNLLYKTADYEHNYPYCWRCHTPLMYYARDTWFIRMTEVRNRLVKNNNTVNWLPENIKQGRFGNFLENVIDWGLSRERYWGTPLPIWECECGYKHAIGSIEELKSMSDNCPDEIELHKPYVDRVFLNCPKCDKKMKRVTEVIDCWFDSGAMPFAQHHFPFENQDIFKENFPADFISEAVDQTRGWFYTLMAISTLLFDESPYKNVIVLGHVLDKDGQKMSKHKGNVIDPWTVLDKQGADAVRWYFFTISAPWLPSRFYEEAVDEVTRKFMGTLKNSYAFYVLYANIDNFNPVNYKLEYEKLAPIDKWILSKLNTLIKFVDESLEDYKITEPARAMAEFIEQLSNWYIRRTRERFWASGMEQDKINAYMTLYTVLTAFIKIAAPFIPFMTETLYQNLVVEIDKNSPESVHLCDFPLYNEKWIDSELEEKMDLVLKITNLGHAARNEANIKNRQPLAVMYVNSEKDLTDDYIEIIKEELNIKEISFVKDTSKFSTFKFKPQLRTLGPKYGKILPKISNYLNEVDGNLFMKQLNLGELTFLIDDKEVTITIDDVIFENVKVDSFVIMSDKNLTIVIDTTLSDDLIEEGFVREIISKIQTMRKEADFQVLDRINVVYSENKKIETVINNNLKDIKSEILADEIIKGLKIGYSKEWNVNGENVIFSVEKA